MSSISCGIVGLPNVGKSTIFNALSNNNALVANYPFATIDPNVGIVSVPDERLLKLAEIFDSQKIVPASIKFVDIAGLIAGASTGEGLGNQFLSHIRSCDAILEVVRVFDDPNVSHAGVLRSPTDDINIINTELELSDLQIIQKRLPRIQKEVTINPKLRQLLTALEQSMELLNDGQLLGDYKEKIDLSLLEEFQFITAKPIIYLFNLDDSQLSDQQRRSELTKVVSSPHVLFSSAKLENEIKDLDELDAQEFLESYGQTESSLSQLVKTAYEVLGLQSFLTAGQKEVRAWTITKGSTAPQAAGVIHSDFEKGFIAAEIVNYQDLLDAGSLVKARAIGKVRTEGKSYIMQPNDVVEFRFNV